MQSVEEACLRRRPPLRQHRQLGGGLFALQMRQNSLDYRRIFNAGNDLDLTTAPFARLDIDVKYTLEPLQRCQTNTESEKTQKTRHAG